MNGGTIPIQYSVNSLTSKEGVSMMGLLLYQDTKRDLSRYFQERLQENQIYFRYVLAGNGRTVGSNIRGYIKNNHE